MRSIMLIVLSACLYTSLQAQLPEDALRLSWFKPSGSARNQAIGGVTGSIGGDISSTFGNPAGLGFYKTSEFILSPGFTFNKTGTNYRGTNGSGSRSAFSLGTTGFVFGNSTKGDRKSSSFSIAVNRLADFNSNVHYKGSNNYSSYSEAFAEELAQSGIDIGDFDNSNLSLGTKSAIYTYLIDTATVNGNLIVKGRPEYLGTTNQEHSVVTTGGITELAVGFASNNNDKLYLGGSIGLPIVNYSRASVFTESDPTSNTNNNFAFSRFEEHQKTTGIGINLKLGLIFKPVDGVRLGLAIHSPTLYGLKDVVNDKMVTDVEKLFGPNDRGIDSVTSDHFNGGSSPEFSYDLTSPWHFMVSGSYIFHENQDVRQQKGFVSADVEYVTYGAGKFTAAGSSADDGYYDGVNTAIKGSYKGAVNVRVGGELKFNTFMTRLGFSYYGNPYKIYPVSANRVYGSAGVGWRNKGFFVDLTYVQGFQKDFIIPYRLSDKDNVFATLKPKAGTALVTFGVKF